MKYVAIKVELLDDEKPDQTFADTPTATIEIVGDNLPEMASVAVWNAVEELQGKSNG